MNALHHTLACVSVLLTPLFVCAQAFDDEDDELRSGLIAELIDNDGHRVTRIDEVISFTWSDRPVDVRLAEGPFSATWTGLLLSDGSGEYEFSAVVEGALSIKIRDRIVLDTEVDQARRVRADRFVLPFNWHPIEITFRSTTPNPTLSLFWKGPGFQLEPIGSRQYYHDPLKTPDRSWRRGFELATTLKCNACHAFNELGPFEPAPDLRKLSGQLHPQWLIDHLLDRPEEVADGEIEQRRMPHFDLDRDQAESIAAFLLEREQPVGSSSEPDDKDLASGKQLFLTLGCLACHQQGELGTPSLYGGGDLSNVAFKRPPSFFSNWLESPAKVNANHRMPVFDLSSKETRQLAAYLATLGDPPDESSLSFTESRIAEGEKLYTEFRCAACHTPDSQQTIGVDATEDWNVACTAAETQTPNQPRFLLTPSDRAALQTFFAQVSSRRRTADVTPLDASIQLKKHQCLECHQRGPHPGLAPKLTTVAKHSAELAPQVPAMTPPSLNSVGDKLFDQALVDAIRRKDPPHRPYLMVRMPRFDLSDDQLSSIASHLIHQDRIVEPELTEDVDLDLAIARVAGTRLVTSTGFGCTSCHQVGDVIPPNAPLNAKGPDISMLGQRIRKPWFDRWVRDPSRIIRGQEMPSVQVAVKGVLNDNLDHQLASIWKMLNTEGFVPPRPGALRTVRQSGLDPNHSPYVLTDVIRLDGEPAIKPFIVGLSNRHSVLIDLQHNRISRWWIGDIAGQHTEGKTWFWEPAGTDLLIDKPQRSELSLSKNGETVEAKRIGQFLTEIDHWRHRGNTLEFSQRLIFSTDPKPNQTTSTVRIQQTITPVVDGRHSGFRRDIVVENAPTGFSVVFAAVDSISSSEIELGDDGRRLSMRAPEAVSIEVVAPSAARFDDNGSIVLPPSPTGGLLKLSVRYVCNLPVDEHNVVIPEPSPQPPMQLAVAPGIETTRLPLPIEWMPTGMAWHPSGDLIVTSLKGRVWIARDTNGDGLEDKAIPVSDELAAPFGAQVAEDHIDVINKYALLRLRDRDQDGFFEETATLASGWGHTEDYHDWSIGLPRDEQGNYFISIACQQDERQLAAAKLRGKVIKLVARQPDADDPRMFSNHVISGGHRFPIGIARNRLGELFVTDNQGNYNPFNELNHVRQGKRFGFINRLEQDDSFNPQLTEPAIDIPHPWTRSVNGVCFLETPDSLLASGKRNVFGPFEGHLLGCEYDTRRLIRMSLQQVGDTFQGAAYPFTFTTPSEGDPLLGPLSCHVAPDGDVYIGSIRDSGWGGSNNIGSMSRMRIIEGDLPHGIAEVTANSNGFTIRFTKPVDRKSASEIENYVLSSYRRISTPAYGGDDVDRRNEKIDRVFVDSDRTSVKLELSELREGFVYEFRLNQLAGDNLFFPEEAFYTLRKIPSMD